MEVNVVGVTFSNPDGSSRTDIIRRLSGSEEVILERDPYNDYDRNAVKVMVKVSGDLKQIGFLPGPTTAEISPKMRRGQKYAASIIECGIWKERPYCQLSIREM